MAAAEGRSQCHSYPHVGPMFQPNPSSPARGPFLEMTLCRTVLGNYTLENNGTAGRATRA